jgi:hypothetical protein
LDKLDRGISTTAFGHHCGKNESTIPFIKKSEENIKSGPKASAPPDAKTCVSSCDPFLEKMKEVL